MVKRRIWSKILVKKIFVKIKSKNVGPREVLVSTPFNKFLWLVFCLIYTSAVVVVVLRVWLQSDFIINSAKPNFGKISKILDFAIWRKKMFTNLVGPPWFNRDREKESTVFFRCVSISRTHGVSHSLSQSRLDSHHLLCNP